MRGCCTEMKVKPQSLAVSPSRRLAVTPKPLNRQAKAKRPLIGDRYRVKEVSRYRSLIQTRDTVTSTVHVRSIGQDRSALRLPQIS